MLVPWDSVLVDDSERAVVCEGVSLTESVAVDDIESVRVGVREWVRVLEGVSDSERVGDFERLLLLLRLNEEESVSVTVALRESVMDLENVVEAVDVEVFVLVELSVSVVVPSDLDLVKESVTVVDGDLVLLTVSLAVDVSE